MNCVNQNYIKVRNFFISLNSKLGDNCFISGTYVFEGDDVFKILCDSGADTRIGQGRILNGKPKSHNLHIFNKLFQAHKLNDNPNIKLIKVDGNDYKVTDDKIFKSYKQYEIDLEGCALQYPCDTTACKQKGGELEDDTNIDDNDINSDIDLEDQDKESFLTTEDNERFNYLNNLKDNLNTNSPPLDQNEVYCRLNKEIKKCCLFYRFHVKIKEDDVRTYTFVKLETSPTIKLRDAFDHAVHAAIHYFTKNGSLRKNTWSIRREDIAVYKVLDENGNEKYIDSFKPSKIKKCSESKIKCNSNSNNSILRFKPKMSKNDTKYQNIRLPYRDNYNNTLPLYNHYNEDNNLFTEFPSFETYNENVRTRNEMFVPLGFYQEFLNISQSGGSSKLSKTSKQFFYNNRHFTVYKDKTNKQEYIKLNKTYTLCKSLKKQTYRKLLEKHLFNGQKYVLYETLKDNRRFIMINERRRYI